MNVGIMVWRPKEKTIQAKGLEICGGLATNCSLKAHLLKAVSPMQYSETGLLDHDWATRALT